MSNSITPYKKLTGEGRCKALLTLVMLILLTLATSARALAEDDREAYAVLDNGTLTFYCDNQKATHSGAMPLNEGNAVPDWHNYADEITTVEFSESFQYARPKTCSFWFYLCTNLIEIKGIQYLNTSEVTYMYSMFRFCSSLQSLDLSGFNTENVTVMSYMFYGCSALETILVGSGWNVDKVTSSGDMFDDCENLTGGSGTTYKDGNPKDKAYARIDGMNGKDGYLTSLEQCTPYAVLEDNPDGKTKTLVFRYGYKPDNAMDLNKGTNFPVWHQDVSKITIVEFDPLFKYARPTTCYAWFSGCTNLTEIKGIEYLNTSEVTLMTSMFDGCTALKSLDLSSFNTSKVTNMMLMFDYCNALESLDLSGFNTENVRNMISMF